MFSFAPFKSAQVTYKFHFGGGQEANRSIIMKNALKDYQLQLSTYPVLSASEQKDLAVLAKKGDKQARELLINCNLRLVYKIFQDNFAWASKNDEDTLDLIQAGNKGLVRAIDDFDCNAGVAFSTYARNKIFNDIQQQYESEGRMIHIPANVLEEITKIHKASNDFINAYGYEPSYEEISDALGGDYTSERVQYLLKCSMDVDSLDKNLGSNDEEYTYSDIYGDNEDVKVIEHDLLCDETFNLYKTLNDDEAYIVSSLFGVFNYKQKNVSELAKELNTSSYKLQKLIDNILIKLRKYADEIGYEYTAIAA